MTDNRLPRAQTAEVIVGALSKRLAYPFYLPYKRPRPLLQAALFARLHRPNFQGELAPAHRLAARDAHARVRHGLDASLRDLRSAFGAPSFFGFQDDPRFVERAAASENGTDPVIIAWACGSGRSTCGGSLRLLLPLRIHETRFVRIKWASSFTHQRMCTPQTLAGNAASKR